MLHDIKVADRLGQAVSKSDNKTSAYNHQTPE
jgi:hypothetical protein